jgi:hypothetical protein
MQYDRPAKTLGIWVWINAGDFFAGASGMMGPFVGIRAVTFAAMLGRPVNASGLERLKLVGA